MHSNSLSTGIQTQFFVPSNSYKHAFNPSPSPHLSFNFQKNRLNSIRKTHNPPPNSTATNGCYTPLPEETLYDFLGIPQSGTISDIKRAYKQMALKYHPDVSPPDQVHEYTAMFIRVQEAYEMLSDPESRAVYDCNLSNGLQLFFSGKKYGCGFGKRSGEEDRWKPSWEVQLEELKRRSTAEMEGVGQGGRSSWATRIRKQRAGLDADQ